MNSLDGEKDEEIENKPKSLSDVLNDLNGEKNSDSNGDEL